jgi:putative tryptophan/tyrosine transport system substrate-binding protein
VQLSVLKAGTEGEIDAAFASLHQLQAGGLVVDSDGFFNTGGRRGQIVALAAWYAIPAIYPHPQYVAAGGLISYGTDEAPVSRKSSHARFRLTGWASMH